MTITMTSLQSIWKLNDDNNDDDNDDDAIDAIEMTIGTLDDVIAFNLNVTECPAKSPTPKTP